jgi:hypothetical protein
MESTARALASKVATAGNEDRGAPASSTLPAADAATTSSMEITRDIIDTGKPIRKRMKPSSSTGETTLPPSLAATAAAAAPPPQQQPSSAAKRKAPGILSTALGWSRSQAADLAIFQETKASAGPEKPLPPLPLPTRRLAAAHHDLVKASASAQKGIRRGGYNGSTRNSDFQQQQQQQQQQQHPVSVAFATGTDPQLASVLGTELTRLGDLAHADPDTYAALAEECKLWAAGATTSVAGLTATDLEKAQSQLKAAMQHVPFSGSAAAGGAGGSIGGSGGRTGYRSGRAVPLPDPRASSYFIQPGNTTTNTTDGNRASRAPQQHQQQVFQNGYTAQYYTGPGPSRLNTSSFGSNPSSCYYQNNSNTYAAAGKGGGSGGGGVTATHRYPRRSSRARNTKRDDMYLTLDSDDDADNDNDNDSDSDHERDDNDTQERYGEDGGGGDRQLWTRGDMRRGPGRPRKRDEGSSMHHSKQQQQQFSPNLMLLHPVQQQRSHHQRMTPLSISPAGVAAGNGSSLGFFSPQLGDVMSPFAQFLFEHSPDNQPPVGIPGAAAGGNGGGGGGNGELNRNAAVAGTISAVIAGGGGDPASAAAAAGNAEVGDVVDYAALDEFISGLNFTNDAVLGSPSALEMLAGAKVAAAAVAATTEAEVAAAVAAAGVVGTTGTTASIVPLGMIPTSEAEGVIAYNTSLQPETAGGSAAPHQLDPSSSAAAAAASQPSQAQLPILDLAICKPLETPTVAGMLSLGLSKKSPTPITSPLLSPTLLALNF